MPLSQPITMFGLHSATIYDRSTKEFAGTLKIVSEATPDIGQESIPLQGGSSAFPWDTATGYASGELPITVKQFDLNSLKYFGGLNSTTANYTEGSAGEASGNASSLINKVGTSVADATTGVDSISVATAASLKFGDYYLKATASSTVDVYLNNDLDGDIFQNDSLKITASALTVPGSGGTVAIPNTGLEIVGGSGSVSFTTGDIASFSVRPINTYYFDYEMGGAGTTLPEFGLYLFTEKLGTDKYRAWHFPRVRSNGMNPTMTEKEWASFESTLTVLYDSSIGYAAKLTVINI